MITVIAAAAATFGNGQVIETRGFQGDGVNRRTDGAYRTSNETTFSGVIAGKVKGSSPGNAQTISLTIKGARNKMTQVDLGPAWFVSQQKTRLNLGDRVTVVGSPIRIGTRERFVLARRVVKGPNVLTLRDVYGYPFWDASRFKSTIHIAGGNHRIAGTVAGTDTFQVDGQSYSGYVVDTPNGLVNVAVAPTWYWNRQPQFINVGEGVSMMTGPNPIHYGNVWIADSMVGGGGSYTFRSNGQPVWLGYGNVNVGPN